MCGRYTLYGPRSRSRAEPDYFAGLDQFRGSWNVTPQHTMPITRLRDGELEQVTARWSLLPHWSKEEKLKFSTHNARCETVATAATYRGPYGRKQRCLVPAAGFYEWMDIPGGKQPYHMIDAEGDLLVFAGLWDAWKRRDGETLTTFTIVTTTPNDVMAKIHDRMPVILRPEDYGAWLEGDDPQNLLRPAHNERLFAYAVSPAVGKIQNNDASLIEPIEDSDRRYLEQLATVA
jgi:putative SOS response-associated peptidase YedK